MDFFIESSSRSLREASVRRPPTSAGGLPCTPGRVLRAERLDSADAVEAERNLRDIARINRWFGGHRTLIQLLQRSVRPHDRFSILDVGAASGDMGQCVQKRFRNAKVVSLDRSPIHLKTANMPKVAADAFALPFQDGSFDFVICSSFLHHFSNGEVVELLRAMRRLARRSVIVLDLERHPFGYFFLPLTRWLFRWSKLTVHDGCASVGAAFRRSELESVALALGPARATIHRHLPWFRLSIVLDGLGTHPDGKQAGNWQSWSQFSGLFR
jgi:SAM-dependent methyltransferase